MARLKVPIHDLPVACGYCGAACGAVRPSSLPLLSHSHNAGGARGWGVCDGARHMCAADDAPPLLLALTTNAALHQAPPYPWLGRPDAPSRCATGRIRLPAMCCGAAPGACPAPCAGAGARAGACPSFVEHCDSFGPKGGAAAFQACALARVPLFKHCSLLTPALKREGG